MATRTQARLNNLNDRAREVGALDVLTQDDIDALKAFYSFTCLHCGASPAISPDHVIPLAAGGSNTIENLQLLCDACNKGKRDRADDYRQGRICTSDYVAQFIAERDEKPAKKDPYEAKGIYIKHDWDAIEFDYISSPEAPTLRELAKKYGASVSHISMISSRENWTKKRADFRDNLVAETLIQALEREIDVRLEISRTALDFLQMWRRQHNEISNQDLIKVLELAARASGLELDRKTLTVKDWRDAAQEGTQEDIQAYATSAAAGYFGEDASGSEGEAERS